MVYLLVGLCVASLLLLGVFIFLSNLVGNFHKEIGNLRGSLDSQMLQMSQQVNAQIAQNTKFLENSHGDYREAVGQVNKQLGQLQQSAHSMMDVGKEIASLHDILRVPKLRGGLGELFLEEILRQILPQENYTLQYGFSDGSKVDAAIFLGEGVIPVDAKFPYENFRRILEAQTDEETKQSHTAFTQDVKKHIDSIASKYILPQEGTFEFAIMYIPAENIYYETIIKEEGQAESISSYAIKKRVIPVSPNSFYAYLQAIVRGLKGMRIERSAKLILESLGQLETDMDKIFVEFEKMGSHLNHAQSSYDKTQKRFDKLKMRIQTMDSQETDKLPEKPLAVD